MTDLRTTSINEVEPVILSNEVEGSLTLLWFAVPLHQSGPHLSTFGSSLTETLYITLLDERFEIA
jgi:hypothetical protein